MANEISVSTGLQVSNGTSVRPSNQQTRLYDQTTAGIGETTASITTSDTAVNLPISTPGWVQLRNDGANPIQYGPDNGSGAIATLGEISAGATHQLQLLSSLTSLRFRTTTGTSTLSIVAIRK